MVALALQLEDAITKAEKAVSILRPDALPLVDLGARWRRLPATEKQLDRLKRAHLHFPPQISRGQASHLIAMLSR
jgi:hypothetical protein